MFYFTEAVDENGVIMHRTYSFGYGGSADIRQAFAMAQRGMEYGIETEIEEDNIDN